MDEHEYRNTRAELDSAMDGELGHVRNQLNAWWFRQQDAAHELSEMINDLWHAHMRLSRMLRDGENQVASFLDLPAGDEEDQHN